MAAASLQASAQDTPSNGSNLQYAEYLVENGRGALAYSTLNDIIRQNPGCAQAYFLRATAYMNDNNMKAAMNDIDLALRHNATNADYMWLKCRLLYNQDKHKAAMAYVEKLASAPYNIMDESDDRKLMAAELMVKNGNTIDALPIINSVEQKSARLYLVRGMAYTSVGMYDLATGDLSYAIDLDPKMSDCYLWMGLAKYKSGNRKEAHNCWQTALQKGNYKAKQYIDKYK